MSFVFGNQTQRTTLYAAHLEVNEKKIIARERHYINKVIYLLITN